ncbi:MAG: fluoroquinolone transporter permease [Rubrobacteraceae bacterium]
MSRFASTVKLDLLLQQRYGFYYAGAFVTVVWISLLLPLPDALLELAVPFVVFTDLAVVGFFFIAGMVLFEKGEATLFALISTPLRFREYLASKLLTLTALALAISLVVAVVGYGIEFNLVLFLLGVIFASLISALVGFITVAPFSSISSYLVPSSLVLVLLGLPVFFYFGLWTNPVFYLFPTQGSLLLLGGAFVPGSLAAWQIAYALAYGSLWTIGLAFVAHKAFDRHIVAREGG